MSLGTYTTALAAATGIGAYLNAKHYLRKDIRTILSMRSAAKDYEKAAAINRHAIWYLFEDQVKEMPINEPCLWSRDAGYFTWQEEYDLSCKYAQFLLSRGVGPGDLVGFYLQNSAEFIHLTLATWAIGTAPALLNFNVGGDGLVHCLKTAGAKIVFVDPQSDVRQRMEQVASTVEDELGIQIVILDEELKQFISTFNPERPGDEYRQYTKGTDPMMLLFTSGTTGFPKACPFDIARAWQSAGARIRNLGVIPGPGGTRWYDCMPLYHGTGFNVAFFCLACGITLCVGKRFSTSQFWDDIRDSDSTAFVYVGETLRYLLNNPPSPRDKEHKVTTIFGNGLRPDVWKRFRDRFGIDTISEFFNSTEGVFSLINVCRGDHLATAVGHNGSLLQLLLRNTWIPVATDSNTGDIWRSPETGFAHRNSYSEGGEILVAVPDKAAFAGYWKNPEATDKKFARNVFQQGDLFYRSGDSLRRDEEGRWYFLDRLGDTFRWKSENVSTAEVAIVLGHYPGIVEANVYGVLVPGHDGRAGCAALYIQEPGKFDFRDLLRYLQTQLPRYAIPVFLRLVQNMTPMHNNKQNKVPLREEGIDLQKIAHGSSPQDKMMWLPPKGDQYVEFGQQDLEALNAEKLKL